MSTLPTLKSSIPIFTSVAQFRQWRQTSLPSAKSSVGFVPTMGALHEGHLSLVRRSLSENQFTVVSIFVNPAQFAPHEDLVTYPRTIESDLLALDPERTWSSVYAPPGSVAVQMIRTVDAVFLPPVAEMYPSGISQDVNVQIGTFVHVKGYSEKMEGESRPTFFRGVTTIVMKLFNAVQPTRAYFGQKDIQQALLLRRMCRDLLVPNPEASNVCIIPTARDPSDGLALSSRNVYLSASGRKFASVFPQALQMAKTAWQDGASKAECIQQAFNLITARQKEEAQDLTVALDYIEFTDPESLDPLPDNATVTSIGTDEAIVLSGALRIDQTRLIDNLILGDARRILSQGP